jgi:hypothetical protein
MGFFTARDRTELGRSSQTQSAMPGRLQEQVRNSVREQRRLPDADLAARVGSPFGRATATSLREIDDLIAELRRRREELLSESAHLQNAIVEYARSNQAVVHSTRAITERLASLYKAPEVHPAGQPEVEHVAGDEEPAGSPERIAQASTDQATMVAPPEAGEASDSQTS